MPLSPEVVTDFVSDGGNLLKLGGAAGAIAVGIKAVNSVDQGFMGVRTTFGRASSYRFGERKGQHKIVGAGGHITFPPIIKSIKPIFAEDRSTDLQPFNVGIKTPDGQTRQYKIGSSITWCLSEEPEAPYRAIFKTNKLEETVTNICGAGLLRVCHKLENPDFLFDEEYMFWNTNRECSENLENYGVLLKRLQVSNAADTDAQVLADAIDRSGVSSGNLVALLAGAGVISGIGGFGDTTSTPAG